MDAKSIRKMADKVNESKQQEEKVRQERWENQRKQNLARGIADGTGKIYKQCLAKIQKAAEEGKYTIEYSFSDESEAYVRGVLSTLPEKLTSEGFNLYRVPPAVKFEHHRGWTDPEGPDVPDWTEYYFSFEIRC